MDLSTSWPGATADAFVLQQTSSLNSNNFVITDEVGEDVARVETKGSALGRFLMGSRSLDITTLDGDVLLRVKDSISIGRDRFVLEDAEGVEVARLVRRLTFVRTAVKAEIPDGPTLSLTGNLWGLDFSIDADGETVASVGRAWAGIARGLLGHSRYAVRFEEGVEPGLRLVVLGVVVALDLMRRKDDAKRAASS